MLPGTTIGLPNRVLPVYILEVGCPQFPKMIVAWSLVAALAVVDITWLRASRLVFVASDTFWSGIGAMAFGVFSPVLTLAAARAQSKGTAIGTAIATVATRLSLFAHGFAFNGALAMALLMFTYLAASMALPLHDATLAAADRTLGFDWVAFSQVIYRSTIVSAALASAYDSSLPQLLGLFIYLSATNRTERLTEVCLLLALVSVIGGAIHVIVPAAGPIAYFSVSPEMLHSTTIPGHAHLGLFTELRTHATPIVNFDTAQGLVTFPSMHAAWAIITTYAMRDARVVIVTAVAALNTAVIVSTVPIGGHYLVDVIAGALIAVLSISIVRRAMHAAFGTLSSVSVPVITQSRRAVLMLLRRLRP